MMSLYKVQRNTQYLQHVKLIAVYVLNLLKKKLPDSCQLVDNLEISTYYGCHKMKNHKPWDKITNKSAEVAIN